VELHSDVKRLSTCSQELNLALESSLITSTHQRNQ
jgi:hypothetical protein